MLKNLRVCIPVALMLTLFLPGLSLADPVAYGRYALSNHPDGNAASPFYGLRLDGLLNWDDDVIYTFDFEAPGAGMLLDYSPGSIHIHGRAWGGEDTGNAYVNAGFWALASGISISPTATAWSRWLETAAVFRTSMCRWAPT